MKLLFLLIIVNCLHAETFYIIPPGGYEREVLFTCVERNDNRLNRDDCVKHFYDLRTALRNLGHDLKTVTTATLPAGNKVITSGIPILRHAQLLKQKATKIITFIWEPLTTEPNSYNRESAGYVDQIFTLWDDEVDNKKYFKHYYTYPYLFVINPTVPFNKKRFLTFISSNKTSQNNSIGELYSERAHSIYFFTQAKVDFTFYGKGWKTTEKTYGGPVHSKRDTLKNFKFCLCFENTRNMNGYITEKIFDCFNAGCVPIYWGAPNITSYIPKDCFIDMRDFNGYKALLNFLTTINEQKYNNYIENIRRFMDSEQMHKFSINHFVKTAINALLY